MIETPHAAPAGLILPLLKLRGEPSTTGYEYGKRSSESIRRCYELYAGLIRGDDDWRRHEANEYFEVIKEQLPDIAVELQAVAEGSELPLWKIVFINARTELLLRSSKVTPVECTSLYFPRRALLGQNWDWLRAGEDIVTVLDIERPDGRRMITLTESGMLAKIGMNSSGLGVCLNILTGTPGGRGVPVHILLRRLLDFAEVESAVEFLMNAKIDTYGNILIADESGGHASIEMAGTHIERIDFGGQCPLHTNHYLTGPHAEQVDPEKFQSSLARLRRGRLLYGELEVRDLQGMHKILTDATEQGNSICRPYTPSLLFANAGSELLMGTVSSVIMGLKQRIMWATRGSPLVYPYVRYEIG